MNWIPGKCDNSFTERVLSAVHVPVVISNLNGEILFVNHAVKNEFGYLPQEIIGKKLSVLLTPEDQKIFYHNLLCIGCERRSFKGELMLVRKDTSRFLSYLTARTCPGPDNGDISMVISIQDIHDLKQLEKERKINSIIECE